MICMERVIRAWYCQLGSDTGSYYTRCCLVLNLPFDSGHAFGVMERCVAVNPGFRTRELSLRGCSTLGCHGAVPLALRFSVGLRVPDDRRGAAHYAIEFRIRPDNEKSSHVRPGRRRNCAQCQRHDPMIAQGAANVSAAIIRGTLGRRPIKGPKTPKG